MACERRSAPVASHRDFKRKGAEALSAVCGGGLDSADCQGYRSLQSVFCSLGDRVFAEHFFLYYTYPD